MERNYSMNDNQTGGAMTEAFPRLGRRLRLGLVGGGPGSFIGPMHRAAALLDRRFDLIAGVLSSDAEKGRAAAAALDIAAYPSVSAMCAGEPSLDAIAVMTPNDRHFDECRTALQAGLHVVCDKPLTNTLAEARELAALAAVRSRVFCLTHAYSAYPMIRQARAMVAAGVLGELRAVQVEYLQGGMSQRVEDGPLTAKLRWKFDTARSGPSLVLGDIGTHAEQLLRFVSGRRIELLSADLGAVVPGRKVQDWGAFLLRMEGDVHGTLTVSQALAGAENVITLRVFGARGHLEWTHARSNFLTFAPHGEPVRTLSRGGPGMLPAAARLVRIPAGHPEGLLEGFANLYRDAAEAMAAAALGVPADPAALDFSTAEDGVAGLAFMAAAIASQAAGGAWTEVRP
jgi:predicted dehydrogenase